MRLDELYVVAQEELFRGAPRPRWTRDSYRRPRSSRRAASLAGVLLAAAHRRPVSQWPGRGGASAGGDASGPAARGTWARPFARRCVGPVEARVLSDGPDTSSASCGGIRRSVTRQLPAESTRLVGRADELELLAGRLRIDRLVTLTGPGGVGKTTACDAARKRRVG